MNHIADALLTSGAVHIKPEPENFFTWTSGKRSPIYCDNRTLISFPKYREVITQRFVEVIKKDYPEVELIAGTATAGIPWAAWLADALNLPMIYIRSKPKGHGLQTAIEGHFQAKQKTLIIEDLISTGKSSIESYHHAKNDKLSVLGVLSIFTYEFDVALEKFKEENLPCKSLCALSEILKHAKEQDQLTQEDIEVVQNWRKGF